ncbi:mitochondrial inner membrane protein OXA1L [Phlebotomus argentipes]|uniref:mitochondrial inner membrane protein OXA1L n=1 Tax=Phlebotomus argentipes TaxID=94469 RepID=UPI00289382C5|nr:mitochondrial inner membrane protein OXA1L [Phlebotomus argentipes]
MLSRCHIHARNSSVLYSRVFRDLNARVLSARNYHILSPQKQRRDPLGCETTLPVVGLSFIRHASTGKVTTVADVMPDIPTIAAIPEPPAIPEAAAPTTVETLVQGAEPAFSTLGLGGWSPVGILQQCMEYLHIGLDLPWWGVIAIGTVTVRTLLFPLVLVAQRNAAKMNNHMPQMQVLQMKMTEARQSGNQMDSARYGQELMMFMKEKQMNPIKNMVVPLAQAPLFISFFMGLRAMANTPVESMKEGGIFWFTDLTVCDPYYIMPIITSATMALTIELGTDSARMSSQNMQTMRYVLRALPLIIIPFTLKFPAAILTYWCCSNFISLVQVGVLKIPKVRKYFNIDPLVTHQPDALPMKKKGFTEGIRESWTNMKITKELEDRRRVDEISFHRAGQGPVIKTYKYDPTKPRPQNAVAAKKR